MSDDPARTIPVDVDKIAAEQGLSPDEVVELYHKLYNSMTLQFLDPTTLQPNDLNWKKHPTVQRRAMRSLIGKAGWAGTLLFNKRTGRLLDGHLRQQEAIEQGLPIVPVLVIDVDEEVENTILLFYDTVGRLYLEEQEAVERLAETIELEEEDILAGLLEGETADEEEEDKDKDLQRTQMPEGGLALPLSKSFNYIVLIFRTEMDWAAAQDFFGVQRQMCPFSKQIGIGRVLDGARIMNRLRDQINGVPLMQDEFGDVDAFLEDI